MGEREPTTSSASTCGDAMDAARPAKRQRSGNGSGTRGPAPPSGVVQMVGNVQPLAAAAPAAPAAAGAAPAPAATRAPAAAARQEETSWDPHAPPHVSPSGYFIRDIFAPPADMLLARDEGAGAAAAAAWYDATFWREVEEGVLVYESRDWATAVRSAKARLPAPTKALPVAALDLDSAVIDGAPFGGATIPASDDFTLRFGAATARKLCDKGASGTLVALLSNQSTVGCGRVKDSVAWLKRRVEAVQRQLGVPLTCYVALRFDRHRIPCVGLWQCLKRRLSTFGVEVDNSSFYVGARAGRIGDASSVDYKFARNVGLKLYTPERLFLGGAASYAAEKMVQDIFEPRDYVMLGEYTMGGSADALPPLRKVVTPPEVADLIAACDKAFLVLLCGGPCTGKTRFATRHLAHLAHFEETSPKQNLAQRGKVVRPKASQIRAALLGGRGAVVDGTHGREVGRQYYVNLAKAAEVPIYCLHFALPRELVRHLDACREINSNGGLPRSGELVFEAYEARAQPVAAKEGYSAPIGEVLFRAHFDTPAEKEVFTRFT